MANVVTKKFASPHRLVYEIAGDGTATSTIASATMIADAVAGPLKDLLSASYASQALMRAAFLYGNPGFLNAHYQIVVADTNSQVNQLAADVDVDAVTATRPEINIQIHDTTGTTAILDIRFNHSISL